MTKIIASLLTSPKVWVGGLLYILATAVYFLLLSKFRFFSVQIGMTALAIVFSTLLSIILFHEKITLLNVLGMVLVLSGIGMVFSH